MAGDETSASEQVCSGYYAVVHLRLSKCTVLHLNVCKYAVQNVTHYVQVHNAKYI